MSFTVPALSVDAGARELGEWGEEVAARLLTAHGYAVLARNWRCRHGELDIVASAPAASTVVGVEVKTRRKGGRVGAIEAVSPEKAARLRRLLAAWADEHDARCDRLRVDLLAITVDDAGECLVNTSRASHEARDGHGDGRRGGSRAGPCASRPSCCAGSPP